MQCRSLSISQSQTDVIVSIVIEMTLMLPTVFRKNHGIPKAMDEECAPFKAGYTLAYSVNLRMYLEPEFCHPAWNNLKSAIRESGLQPAFLKATLMSHVNHSPYGSGVNMNLKREICESLIDSMSGDEFQRLCEDIAWDRGVDFGDETLPHSPEELLSEPTIAKRGIFVTRTRIQKGGFKRYNKNESASKKVISKDSIVQGTVSECLSQLLSSKG